MVGEDLEALQTSPFILIGISRMHDVTKVLNFKVNVKCHFFFWDLSVIPKIFLFHASLIWAG